MIARNWGFQIAKAKYNLKRYSNGQRAMGQWAAPAPSGDQINPRLLHPKFLRNCLLQVGCTSGPIWKKSTKRALTWRVPSQSSSARPTWTAATCDMILQGDPKKMYHKDSDLKSVLEVRFLFSTCVLESEFWARFILPFWYYPLRIISALKTPKTHAFFSDSKTHVEK